MLLLLPPSEGKTAPARGRAVDLAALCAPELAPAREQVLETLAAVSARADAPAVLGIGTAVAEEVRRNTALRAAPAAPAASVYTGVLHAAAGLAGLTGTARRRATQSVRIFSGLFGVLSPADRIPAYRLSMDVDLSGLGRLSTFWRDHLPGALDGHAAGDVVVDCRSAAYAAAWRPPADAEHVRVQVVREREGCRQVVSHNAKHARGLLTRHLLVRAGRPPRTAGELAAAAQEMVLPAGAPGADAVGAVHAVELDGGTLTLVERA